MRSLLLFTLLSVFVLAVRAGHTVAPDYPAPADQRGKDGMCLLTGLTMGGGLNLVGPFSPETFDYTCTCNDWSNIGTGPGQTSPVLTVDHMDSGSYSYAYVNGQIVDDKRYDTNGTFNLRTNFKDGDNLIQVLVQCESMPTSTHTPCKYQYTIVCNKPAATDNFIVGDPSFVGLRGQHFQVHGVSGEIYNIVSDKDLQYNSRFVFLTSGDCPIVNGRKQKGCWSHPGSFLGELGLKTRAGDQIRVLSGGAKEGFATIEVNGKALEIGDTIALAGDLGSVSFNSTHVAAVQIGNWDMAFENSDLFINQRVRVLEPRTLRSHGLLGQTWRDATYPNALKFVQGEVDDYVIRDNSLFGDSFVFNAFN